MMMTCVNSVLVVGGGFAGLVTAAALARQGVKCELVEANHSALGASIVIADRALHALEELGLFDQCVANGTPDPLADRERSLAIFRPTLFEILKDGAERLGANIRLGVKCTDVTIGEEITAAEFSDGTCGTYDLVVGADGIMSSIREKLFGEKVVPQYSGQSSFRWMTEGLIEANSRPVHGSFGKLLSYQLPGQFFAATIFAHDRSVVLTQEMCRAMLREQLVSLGNVPHVVELLRRFRPDTPVIFKPFDWLLLPRPWYRDRAIIIGDAAHATTAHLGSGGSMAIEDGMVLAEELRDASALPVALERFMARRFDRVRFVVEESVAMSRLEQEGKVDSMALSQRVREAQKKLTTPY